MKRALLVTALVAVAHGMAFRPALAGSTEFWLWLAVPYALLAGFAVWRLWDDGTLLDVLKPKWGDLSIGALTAAVLLVGSWLLRSVITPPSTERGAWLFRLYLQVGDSEVLQRSIPLTTALLFIPVCEELVWRGWVQRDVTEAFGTRRGWPIGAGLYAVAVLPTAFLLADPVAGANPLLVLAALGTGLFWGFMTSVLGRLPPVIISHMAFTYFSAVQFRFPGG
ncbi:MAG: CPBP family intramembrane metalloprotease [Polyangiaceae bacterium]|nr:CPBP family intramembrane metalloprotease [Polyangiaceae bacterium]